MPHTKINAVWLDQEKCKGCISCMKLCPTEAIRVRNGKAQVHYDKCIACGECVRVCRHHAKNATYDNFNTIDKFKYKVALPAPALFGQFNNLKDINYVLDGLLRIGFDDIYEVAYGAEIISEATKLLLKQNKLKKPIISTACPVISELILMKFHALKDNLLPLIAPVDVAAINARKIAMEKSKLKAEEIGVFFISPCPAKVFALKKGAGSGKIVVDGVLAINEIYFKLVNEMKNIDTPKKLNKAGIRGIQWAHSGGEAIGIEKDKYVVADGMESVIKLLEQIEDGRVQDIDFVEMSACQNGCVGGVLNIEDPSLARMKLRLLMKILPQNTLRENLSFDLNNLKRYEEPELLDVLKYDDDIVIALKKMKEKNELLKRLPDLDCGACGAPSCAAFAEDVMNDNMKITDCIRMEQEEK